ncbi:hypothetical protein [Fibrella forsythiae]|uniref:Uncharacterized protein n=1 Tax=Fibrella forsythiae TaxID=2817061 RepID=A0ABS3JKY8_9BACT|nr:hypothetical protein [Fibrella forsythiae]MBO0950098.1 hypothetical protein [Fibrella forsythiae]
MNTIVKMALLLTGLSGTAMAQQPQLTVPDNTPNRKERAASYALRAHLAMPGNRRNFEGRSHIEVNLSKQAALIIGFNRYAQVRARQNIDSVLRLFVTDYAQIRDSTATGTSGLRFTYRLSPAARVIDQRASPPVFTSFQFNIGEPPALLKLRQDTLRVLWENPGQRTTYHQFAVYLLLNSIDDIAQLLAEGGVNARIQTALDNVQNYKNHDLTNPKMAFNLVQTNQREYKFINPGLARSPFISLQPGLGVGLIRNQLAPSLSFSAEFIPSRIHTVGYSVNYLSTFFFQNAADGQAVQRTDFLNVGLTFYHSKSNSLEGDFSRVLAGFYVGIPVYRSGNQFAKDAIRLSGTMYQKGFIKVQPEIYMNGFFKQVYPGLRVGFGL